jgi:hypothetical protein
MGGHVDDVVIESWDSAECPSNGDQDRPAHGVALSIEEATGQLEADVRVDAKAGGTR